MQTFRVGLEDLKAIEVIFRAQANHGKGLWDFRYRLKPEKALKVDDYTIDLIYWSASDEELEAVKITHALRDLSKVVMPLGNSLTILYPDNDRIVELYVPQELVAIAKRRAIQDRQRRVREAKNHPSPWRREYAREESGYGILRVTDRHVQFYKPNAVLRFGNQEAEKRFKENLLDVSQHVERLMGTAQGYSANQKDVTELWLYSDGEERDFYFAIAKPQGRIMNGGIIWHDGRYSVHT